MILFYIQRMKIIDYYCWNRMPLLHSSYHVGMCMYALLGAANWNSIQLA